MSDTLLNWTNGSNVEKLALIHGAEYYPCEML